MMPFAVATPETETVKRAHRKTLDLDEALAEKASFVRVEEAGTANKPSEEREEKHVIETVTKQHTTRSRRNYCYCRRLCCLILFILYLTNRLHFPCFHTL